MRYLVISSCLPPVSGSGLNIWQNSPLFVLSHTIVRRFVDLFWERYTATYVLMTQQSARRLSTRVQNHLFFTVRLRRGDWVTYWMTRWSQHMWLWWREHSIVYTVDAAYSQAQWLEKCSTLIGSGTAAWALILEPRGLDCHSLPVRQTECRILPFSLADISGVYWVPAFSWWWQYNRLGHFSTIDTRKAFKKTWDI